MKKIIIVLLLAIPLCGWGQSKKISPYTQHFLTEYQEAKKSGNADGLKRFKLKSVPTEETMIPVFLHVNTPEGFAAAEEAGARLGTVVENIATARVSINNLSALAALDEVTYIEMGTPVFSKNDESKKMTGVDMVLAGNNLPQAFTGKDVIVGMVDLGLEYGHLNFWNADRTELRVKRVWNQWLEGGNTPEPFGYGAEHVTQAEILAAGGDVTADYHGTHTTGIAAGSYVATDGTDYRGAAPDADIVLVSLNHTNMLSGDNTAVIDAIKYIFDYADEVGKPCVINLSLGSCYGPHDGTSTFDQMCDAMQGEGRLLVGSVGNEGQYKMSVTKAIDPAKNDTLKTFIDYPYPDYEMAMLEVWGSEEEMELHFTPVIYNVQKNRVEKILGEYVVSPENDYTLVVDTLLETEGDFINGQLMVGATMSPQNNKPYMMLGVAQGHSDVYKLGLCFTSPEAGRISAFTDVYSSDIPPSFFTNFGVAGYTDGSTNGTMGEIGGTGKRIISVGAYVSRDYYESLGIYKPAQGETLNELCTFSSYGPTPDGRVKPEITAPGLYIASSASAYFTGTYPKLPVVKWNDVKYYFGYSAGTSMAAPAVTGIMATWLQAYPNMTPERAKEIMRKTAIKDEFTGEIAATGDDRWGYGKIDAYNGIKACIEEYAAIGEVSANQVDFVLINNGDGLQLVFARNMESAQVKVYGMDGACVWNETVAHATVGNVWRIDLSSLSQGVYLIQVIDARGAQVQKFVNQ